MLLCLGASVLVGGVATAASACSSAATTSVSSNNDSSNSAKTSNSHPSTNSQPTVSNNSGHSSSTSGSTSSSANQSGNTSNTGTTSNKQSGSKISSSAPTNNSNLTGLTWKNGDQPVYLDLANNSQANIPLTIEGSNVNATPISYYLTCPTLNLNNYLLETNTANAFSLNSSLDSILSTAGSYLSATLTAKSGDISSKPLSVVFYNSNAVNSTIGQQKLFWIPETTNTNTLNSTTTQNFKLLTNYSLPQGDSYVLTTTVQSYAGVTTNYQEHLTVGSNGTFSLNLSSGYQTLQLSVVNKSGQVVAVSNVLSINGQNPNYIQLSSDSLVNNTINVTNGNATINVSSNISGFTLSSSDIYYQNVNTNNQWVSVSSKTPKFFSAKVSGNQIQISGFYTNFATNIKVIDPTNGDTSQMLTLSSFVQNGGYKTTVYANSQAIQNNSFTTTDKSVNLKFATNLNAKLLNY